MTLLERPSLTSQPQYDWDALVDEERAHRLLYVDPEIFRLEMTHIFGGTWTYIAHESEIAQRERFHHAPARHAARHRGARRRGQSSRAVQPLHASRHHAVPAREGQRAPLPVPLSRLELRQHRATARRALAGWLRRRHARSEIQRRTGAARRKLSRLHLLHTQHGRAAARRSPRADHATDRRLGAIAIPAASWKCARQTASSTRATGSSPTTTPAMAITSSTRTAR